MFVTNFILGTWDGIYLFNLDYLPLFPYDGSFSFRITQFSVPTSPSRYLTVIFSSTSFSPYNLDYRKIPCYSTLLFQMSHRVLTHRLRLTSLPVTSTRLVSSLSDLTTCLLGVFGTGMDNTTVLGSTSLSTFGPWILWISWSKSTPFSYFQPKSNWRGKPLIVTVSVFHHI